MPSWLFYSSFTFPSSSCHFSLPAAPGYIFQSPSWSLPVSASSFLQYRIPLPSRSFRLGFELGFEPKSTYRVQSLFPVTATLLGFDSSSSCPTNCTILSQNISRLIFSTSPLLRSPSQTNFLCTLQPSTHTRQQPESPTMAPQTSIPVVCIGILLSSSLCPTSANILSLRPPMY